MKVDVLDKGYIELVDTLGDDLTQQSFVYHSVVVLRNLQTKIKDYQDFL